MNVIFALAITKGNVWLARMRENRTLSLAFIDFDISGLCFQYLEGRGS